MNEFLRQDQHEATQRWLRETPGTGTNMKIGTTIKGRYRLISRDAKGTTWERIKTGKTFRVTERLLDRCRTTLQTGGSLARRCNGPTGISYTVAIEEVVVATLGLTLTGKEWTR